MDNKDEYLNKDEYNIEVPGSEEGLNAAEYINDVIQNEEIGEDAGGEKDDIQDHYIDGQNVYGTQDVEREEPAAQYLENELQNAGLQTNFIEEESKHILHFIKEGYEPEMAEIEVEMEDNILGQYIQNHQDYGNSPIQENEDEQYSTPQDGYIYNDENLLNDRSHLFQIANEVKKKDQSRKFVLWETNEMRNKWDDKIYSNKKHAISQK